MVTGGASAAYGSDAIAGVVNFIMKKNFEGFQVDGQLAENWHDNDDTYRAEPGAAVRLYAADGHRQGRPSAQSSTC